ncbi:hypothetical protein C8R43DRAFT_1229891 [Mycena crocata]|nr:hypothetical protein C8R43DRAFT_1229891 [Mycena crocata]
MISPLATIVAFVASVSAIAITSPGDTNTWTNDGSQTNFTIVLTNINRSLQPTNNQILKALVDTSAGTTTVDPPSEGWPSVGGTYRVNFCKSSEELDSILAQSDEFNITQAKVESSSAPVASKTASLAAASTPGSGSAALGGATPNGGSGVGASESASDDAPAPTGSSAALPAIGMPTGFLGALVLLGALFA